MGEGPWPISISLLNMKEKCKTKRSEVITTFYVIMSCNRIIISIALTPFLFWTLNVRFLFINLL